MLIINYFAKNHLRLDFTWHNSKELLLFVRKKEIQVVACIVIEWVEGDFQYMVGDSPYLSNKGGTGKLQKGGGWHILG